MSFNHKSIEKKWQDFWEKDHTFKTTDDKNKENFYALDMFPYPSGQGLHVGHPEGYTATDIISRMKRAKDITCFTQWAGMLLVYLPNNMQLMPGTIQLNLQRKIFKHSNVKSIH